METTANSSSPAHQIPAILITGATGNIGRELVKCITERGVPFRVMVRNGDDVNTKALADLPGCEIVVGDFDKPATLDRTLTGVERAFLLTPSSEQAEGQQLRFVAAAQQAGVRHIIKLSQLAAEPHSPVRFLRYHAVVEQAIRDSGTAFTFLRPNLFMQGLLGFRDSIIHQNKFFAAISDARISLIDVRDIAAVAAEALTGPGQNGKTYTLTGPESLTHRQLADQLSVALGRTITFISVAPEAMREGLNAAGFPAWQADGLIEDYAHYDRNEAADVSQEVEAITGKAPRCFADFASDYASVLT